MPEAPQLLIVDDDEAICLACHRVLSRDGFNVKVSTDPCQGLHWALETDCDCILLDIKMPKMDGIQFLECLRAKNLEVPVLIMTGYPGVPGAAAAIRLGISDYIAKPFTAEEIGRAVRRALAQRLRDPAALVSADAESEDPQPSQCLFWDEAWGRLESDGSACVGAVLPELRAEKIAAVLLPQVGQIVYQGLPLAAVTFADGTSRVVASPASGLVVGVNGQLSGDPGVLMSDPCGSGWMACIHATRFEEEVGRCTVRRLVLANRDESAALAQAERLRALGCETTVVRGREELRQIAQNVECRLLLVDAVSFGAEGLELVAQFSALSPSWKIVVMDSPDGRWETDYRRHRIFYFAVAPFADNEIFDILAAAFRVPESRSPQADQRTGPGDPFAGIDIRLADGQRVCLLPAPGLLRDREGLGSRIGQRLTEAGYAATTISGEANLAPAAIVKKAAACDRLIVLLAKDGGGLPGALVRGLPAECAPPSADVAARVTWLTIQPDAVGGLGGLESRTVAALAGHIVREMTLCGRPLG
jgi:two-component system, response regulator, stage 0 sporulation protein F